MLYLMQVNRNHHPKGHISRMATSHEFWIQHKKGRPRPPISLASISWGELGSVKRRPLMYWCSYSMWSNYIGIFKKSLILFCFFTFLSSSLHSLSLWHEYECKNDEVHPHLHTPHRQGVLLLLVMSKKVFALSLCTIGRSSQHSAQEARGLYFAS